MVLTFKQLHYVFGDFLPELPASFKAYEFYCFEGIGEETDTVEIGEAEKAVIVAAINEKRDNYKTGLDELVPTIEKLSNDLEGLYSGLEDVNEVAEILGEDEIELFPNVSDFIEYTQQHHADLGFGGMVA